MKKTLITTTLAAALTLTACGSGTDATEAASPNIQPVEPTFNTTLEPDPDGHEIHIQFQWIPENPDPQPVDVSYYMRTSGSDGMAYSTPIMEHDVLPSMDSGEYESFVYEVPDGGHASGYASVYEPPNTGRLSCLATELNQEVVLDYQESLAGEDSVSCYAFTEQGHTYDSGTPPVDVTF